MASDALREMSGIDDPVRLACARITHSWLQLRHAKYGAVISEVEDALRVVLQHRCVEVIRAELVLGWALLHAGEWGRMYSVVTSAAAHANKQGNSRIEASLRLSLPGCLLNVASTITRVNCVRRRCNAQYILITASAPPCVM